MIKELLPLETLVALLCYPWIELKQELHALFIEHRHTTRSAIRICSILLAICVGLLIFFNNPSVREFFKGLIEALSFVPEALQYNASISLATLSAGSFGAYASKAVIRSVCKCKFGDPDFFLTEARTTELLAIFEAQELDVDVNLLKEVIQFCTNKLREPQAYATIGARKQDWEYILNAIIYEADLDIFLEQQRALHYSHRLILDKKAAINSYKELVCQEHNYRRTAGKIEADSTNRTLHLEPPTEHTPLLTVSFNGSEKRASIPSSSSKSSTDEHGLAKRVLSQFRHTYQNKQYSFSEPSPEQIADQCSQHLETMALSTHQQLLYSRGVRDMISNSTTSATEDAPYNYSFTHDMFNAPPPSPRASHRSRTLSSATEGSYAPSKSNLSLASAIRPHIPAS